MYLDLSCSLQIVRDVLHVNFQSKGILKIAIFHHASDLP